MNRKKIYGVSVVALVMLTGLEASSSQSSNTPEELKLFRNTEHAEKLVVRGIITSKADYVRELCANMSLQEIQEKEIERQSFLENSLHEKISSSYGLQRQRYSQLLEEYKKNKIDVTGISSSERHLALELVEKNMEQMISLKKN